MSPTDEAYTLTLDLLAVGDPDTDPRVAALAHLGAAVALFERFDPETADRLLAVIERGGQLDGSRKSRDEH